MKPGARYDPEHPTDKRTWERFLRNYAAHLACVVRGPFGGPYTLHKRYGDKCKIGGYRSVATLKLRIERWGDRLERDLESPR
jgi:hypothetical protein